MDIDDERAAKRPTRGKTGDIEAPSAAARELGLASLPVQVKLVHMNWLRKLVGETGLSAHEALVVGLKRLSRSADADRS
jgi:hypothetical protein